MWTTQVPVHWEAFHGTSTHQEWSNVERHGPRTVTMPWLRSTVSGRMQAQREGTERPGLSGTSPVARGKQRSRRGPPLDTRFVSPWCARPISAARVAEAGTRRICLPLQASAAGASSPCGVRRPPSLLPPPRRSSPSSSGAPSSEAAPLGSRCSELPLGPLSATYERTAPRRNIPSTRLSRHAGAAGGRSGPSQAGAHSKTWN